MNQFDRIGTFCEKCRSVVCICGENAAMYERLRERSVKIDLLEKYSKWLEEHGYLDSDWWAEQPNTVERFME